MAEIEGGYILIWRKLIESEIWEKPPIYLKVWLYILAKAQHKQYKNLDRGELLISIPELIEVCSYKVGYRTERPSKTQIYNILEWLRNSDEGANEGQSSETMITTTKTTRGMVVKVHNYNVYQDPKSYERNDGRNDEATANGTMPERQADTINKNDKNEKNKEDKKNSRKQVYDESSIHYQLANRLYQKILANNPDHKKPNLQTWANDIRLMMERDNRNEKQIIYTIDWCQSNEFWKTNILSVAKLREKFDQLVMQIKRDHKKPTEIPVYESGESDERSNEQHANEHGHVRLFK